MRFALVVVLSAISLRCGNGAIPADGGAARVDGGSPAADGGLSSVADGGATAADGGWRVPSAHPRIYLDAANLARLRTSLARRDAPAVRFQELVDRAVGGAALYAYEAWFSALLYRVTGEARYGDDAVARVDALVAAEEARIAAGERAEVAGDSYLYVGPTIGDLALTYDWCHELLGETQKRRWLAYADQAVWNVWNHMAARWGNASYPWSGWSVDNPSNNYFYSFLKATMLLGLAAFGEHERAQGWLRTFRDDKLGAQLLPAFARDLAGGGSREGTGYGVSMRELFKLYDVWHATTGERLDSLTPHARDSLAYLMHATMPTLDRIAPIGDHARDSTAALFDYHRGYVQTLSRLYRNEPIAGIAKTYLRDCSVPRMSQGFMFVEDFLYDEPALLPRPLAELPTVYHAAGVGHVFARSDWSRSATWLGFVAGPYSESHAHQDQLSFLLYKTEWLAYDANIDSHSGIRGEPELHNLVRFERAGETVRMIEGAAPARLLRLANDARLTYAAADGTPVYDGNDAVARVEREVVFLKPDVLVVFDRVAAPAGVRKVWQLNTPVAPIADGGALVMRGAQSALVLHRIAPVGAAATTVAWASIDDDLLDGHRIDLADSAAGLTHFLNVLSLDGAVTAANAAHASGELGVALQLRGGGRATLRFSMETTGGTLELRDDAGAVVRDGALPSGVATP